MDATAMDLEFISFSNPSEAKTKDTRKLVRSHAMQHFRTRQRLDVRKDPHALQHRSIRPSPLVEHPRGTPTKHAHRHYPVADKDEDNAGMDTRHVEIVRVERKEQFGLYPISPAQKYIFTIFDHYGAAIAGGLLPLGKFVPTNPIRTRVLPLVNHDTALFHIILAHAGMDMMTWRGEQFFDPSSRSYVRGRERGTVFCTKHKMESIRIINERLNDPLVSISDETILAVSHIASYEMLASATKRSENRFKEFKVHMDGLEQMIKLRGGLKAIGFSTCLTHLVLRLDHLYSALTESQPRFTIEDSPEDILGPLPRFTLVQSPGIISGISNRRLLEVLHQLRNASQFLESLEDHVSERDFFAFGINRALIEDSLFRLGNLDGLLSRDTLAPIEKCCRFSALLFVQTALTKVNCKVYRGMVTTLRKSIEQVGVRALQEENPDLLLWMLLIGGGAAPYNIDRPWFMKGIEEVLCTSSWKEVENRLQGWPWRPKYCVSWRMIWRDAVKSAIMDKNKKFLAAEIS